MVISKLVAVAVVGVSLVVGGNYALQQKKPDAGLIGSALAADVPQGKALVEAKANTQDEKEVLERFHQIQKDITDKNYARLGTYGTSSILSQKDPEKVKEYIEKGLSDNLIDSADYLAKGTATAIEHTAFNDKQIVALVLTEPWHETTAQLWFTKADGNWTVTDINQLKGLGREIQETSIAAPTPANTSAMTNEEIVRNFYQALIEKKFDLATGYMQFPDEKMGKQFRNLLAGLLPVCPIKEIREIKVDGDKATVRIGVQQGFPGGGIKNLRSQDERTAKIDMVEGATGKKISYTSSFLGDRPRNYE